MHRMHRRRKRINAFGPVGYGKAGSFEGFCSGGGIAQLVYGYAEDRDLLNCLSTSGNSKNIINAAEVAKALGTKILSLTGEGSGALPRISDVTIKVPTTETYKVQEYHLPIYHYLCLKTEEYFFAQVQLRNINDNFLSNIVIFFDL